MTARRVLLIDDYDDQRSMLANALRSRGWSVDAVRTGKLGIEAMQRVQPEFVLTELILPDVRGFGFARSLRSLVEHDIVVIALTRVPRELHERALMAGFDQVMCKPVVVDELHAQMLQVRPATPRAS